MVNKNMKATWRHLSQKDKQNPSATSHETKKAQVRNPILKYARKTILLTKMLKENDERCGGSSKFAANKLMGKQTRIKSKNERK